MNTNANNPVIIKRIRYLKLYYLFTELE